MTGRNRTRLAVAALTLTAAVCLAPREVTALEPGMRLIDFKLENMEGTEVSLENLRVGARLVVVVFWATWSESSLREVEKLAGLASLLADGLRVIAINAEAEFPDASQRAAARKVARGFPMGYVALFDRGLSTFRDYTVSAIPTTFVADEKGIVIFRLAGFPVVGGQRMLTLLEERIHGRHAAPGPWAYRPKPRSVRYYNLARILLRKGDRDMAVHTLQRAAEIDPQYIRPYALLGDIDRSAGNLDRALEHYSRALRFHPRDSEVLSKSGECLLLSGNVEEGMKQIRSALEEDSANGLAHAHLAFGLALMNQFDEAEKEFARAAELAPRDHRVHVLRAKTYERQKMTEEAIASYWQAYDLLVPGETVKGTGGPDGAGKPEAPR